MDSREQSLQVVPPAQLVSLKKDISVRQLEEALLRVFPVQDALDWDHTGLLVGDPDVNITGVAIALDPTIRAMETALAVGANVLITHHPLFIEPPDLFIPAHSQGENAGSRVAYALSNHLNCMNFHTACDVSCEALDVLPAMLRLESLHPLEPLAPGSAKGFGMVCRPAEDEKLTLTHLAARCVSVFGAFPRVWGNPETRIERIATCGGSASDALVACDEQAIECLICGEVKYHDALDAAESGLCIIELGHDVSELPLCALLASETIAAGIPESSLTVIDQSKNWYTPETTRR